ncbi:MAG: class I mannose-6-phosphate isomerase [Anaerolineae bacterium]|nr:class I mannose-6-phosphate isomerase [Anaerolineae bacterium]
MSPLPPLPLQPELKEKVWGGSALFALLGLPPTAQPIGEAWLIFENLLVIDGPWAGCTLAALTESHPEAMLGAALARSQHRGAPRFPLLAKLIEAREWLSVQVHPDDIYAREREGEPYGKAEAWYILRAEPGAQIIHGVREPIARESLITLAQSGALHEKLAAVSVHAGDVILNLPGTIHALGPGIVLYEIQQSSDLTYRLYDWGRPASTGRALHLRQSADVSVLEPLTTHILRPIPLAQGENEGEQLVHTPYFTTERWVLRHTQVRDTQQRSPHLLTALRGAGRVVNEHGEALLTTQASVVVPAAPQRYTIEPSEAPLEVLVSYC